MAIPTGRLQRRIRLAAQVKLLDARKPELAENAVTENVSPQGARVLVKTPMQPETLLFLISLEHNFRTSVRVIYCEPLSSEQFGVGLQLQEPSVNLLDKVGHGVV
jgi:hypothetical protein